MDNCSICKTKISGKYCSYCGQPAKIHRINADYILNELRSIFNFEKGIFYTIRELLLRPGQSVRNFIFNDRNRLVKPLVFIIVSSLIYTLLQQGLAFEDGYVNYQFDEGESSSTMLEWVTANYGYANLMISVFIAGWIKLFFRKQGFNIYEILILLCFIIGMGMLIFALFGVIDTLLPLNIMEKGFLIGVIYISWGIGQFFEGNKLKNGLKAFLSYMLGVMTFTIVILSIGYLVDLLKA